MLLHHALLGLSALALGAASLRVASLAAPGGLERAIAVAPIAAGAAGIEMLALGLAGLAGDALVLAAGSVAGWVAARVLLPAPTVRPAEELWRWWRTLTPGQRALTGALAGAGLVLVVWFLRHPLLGEDGVTYHVPISASWVHSGHAGSVVNVFYGLPGGNYPLTNELLTAWAMGISRSLVAVTLWTPLMIVLVAAGAWLGLRTCSVPRIPATLGTAGLCALPLVVAHLNEPSTDAAALAWLVCGAALCAASRRRPALLGPAILALGLAVGTKTTAFPLAALVLAAALYAARAQVRHMAPALGIAGIAALAVGGVWYLRNLIDHGSPLWPFVAAPWGDPSPPFLEHLRFSLLDRPVATLDGRLGDYVDALSGGLVLLAGALVAPLLVRTRAVAAAAGATGVAVLLWCSAPVTGRGDIPVLDGLALTTTRYLLPALAAAVLTLALAAREGRAGGRVATLLLAGALVWAVVDDLGLGFPFTPSGTLLLVAAGGAAVLGWAAGWVPVPGPRAGPAAVVIATAAAAGALALVASGYVARHTPTWRHPISQLTAWFATQPGFAHGGAPIAMAANLDGALVGDELQHGVELIPPREPCPEVRARLKRGWVVVSVVPRLAIRGHPDEPFPELGSAPGCLRSRPPAYASAPFLVYAPDAQAGRAQQGP